MRIEVIASIGTTVAILMSTATAETLSNHDFFEWRSQRVSVSLADERLAAERIVSLEGEESHTVEPYLRVMLHFHPNGDVEQIYERAIQFMDRTGTELNGNHRIYIDSHSERVAVEQASVLLRDGRFVEVDSKTVQLVTADRSAVFSDDYEIVIPWPALEEGATAFLRYNVLTRRDRLAVPWSAVFYPRTFTPRGRFELQITWAIDARVPRWETDLEELRCQQRSPQKVLCIAEDLRPLKQDADVNYYDELPHVLVTERVSWEELAAQIGGYVLDAQSDRNAIEKMVQQVTRDADSEADRLEALHAFVSGDIRYVGIETGTSGIIPRKTGDTLALRYGDCKDKTALFLDMARIADIEAYPVLVSTERKDVSKLRSPAISYFDHMVACGVINVTTEFCVDLTDPYTNIRAFPSYLHGAVSLTAQPGVQAPKSLRSDEYKWVLSVKSDNRVTEDGMLEEQLRREYWGTYAGVMRAGLDGLSDEELREWAVDDYQSKVGATVEPEFEFEGLSARDERVLIASKVNVGKLVDPGTVLSFAKQSAWLNDLADAFGSANEFYAYSFPGFMYKDELIYVLEPGWQLQSVGPEIAFESEFGNMKRTYKRTEAGVLIVTAVEIPRRSIPIAQLASFNRFLSAVLDHGSVRFFAKPR